MIPVRWTGPSLNPESPKVATETVELAHHGFLPGTRGVTPQAIALRSAGGGALVQPGQAAGGGQRRDRPARRCRRPR